MHIRVAEPEDHRLILEVHRLAFAGAEEADLVHELIHDDSAKPLLSIVAEKQGTLVGHVLFTAVQLTACESPARCSILAPLAVVPDKQGIGIGRELISFGCTELERRGQELVFVLGEPNYYTRFGFVPAAAHGLFAPYVVTPDEAWMVRSLGQHALGRVQGSVVCARSLQPEKYWRE
jgi:predicted N-acetyltransferase YhbS